MPSSKVTTTVKRLSQFLPFLIVVLVGVPTVGMAGNETAKLFGLRTIPVPVVGTGSMYPSLFWSKAEGGPEDEAKQVVEEYRTTPHLYRRFGGITILGHVLFHKSVGYGDMVAFKNAKTTEILQSEGKDTGAGFIKRVIGIPGDTIELRDGFVYRNDSLLSEPYIDAPRSTYGGTGLADCIKSVIPLGYYFVLGDNRKVSSDSRYELGLIQEGDIEFTLPYDDQQIYHSLWRDTSKDSELLGQPSLSADEFLSLVNGERKLKGVARLTLKQSLIKSATARGEHLLKDPKTSYDMKQAVASSGYTNILLGEFVSHGHFTAKELLENLLFNSGTAKQIINKDYTDLGIAAVDREVNGCPTQIIVGHLGGYIEASYDQSTVDSWHALLNNLSSTIPSWEAAVGNNNINQDKLSTLLTILHRRQSLAMEIVAVMDKKAWLTDDQLQRIKNDSSDASTAETLATELNKQ